MQSIVSETNNITELNLKRIREWDRKAPLLLHSYPVSDAEEQENWDVLEENDEWYYGESRTKNSYGHGLTKFTYDLYSGSLPTLERLRTSLVNRIVEDNKFAVWVSESEAKGSDWHIDMWPFGKELEPNVLFCMNISGTTLWNFDGYDDMTLSKGDCILINGSVRHRVIPKTQRRLTFAGFGGLSFLSTES